MNTRLGYALPGVEEFGLAEVPLLRDPGLFPVEPVRIGLSEDELRHKAEAGDWDLYETHEIDVPQVSLAALKLRHRDVYRKVHSGTDAEIAEPGYFIKALWEAQRELPNPAEYSRGLLEQGILKPRDAGLIPHLGTGNLYANVPSELSEEDADDLVDLRNRLHYIVNTSDVAASGDAVRETAAKFSYHNRHRGDSARHRTLATELLLEARGLDADEIARLTDPQTKIGVRSADRFRFLGLPADLAEQAAVAPNAPWTDGSHSSVNHPMLKALEGDFDSQIAVRQFFGPQNTFDLLQGQRAATEWTVENEGKFSLRSVTASMSGTLMASPEGIAQLIHDVDPSVPESERRFSTMFAAPARGERGVEADRFRALAFYAVHESVLRPLLHHEVENEIQARYRLQVDSPKE